MENVPMVFLRKIFLASLAFYVASASAKDAVREGLSSQEIRQRLSITAEVFVFDASGKKLLEKMSEFKTLQASRGAITEPLYDKWSSRSSSFEGIVSMETSWEVKENGEIKGRLTQYASDSETKRQGENRYARVLKTEERTVELMGAITWVSVHDHHGKKVVVRYTPTLRDDIPTALTEYKIAGDDIAIIDNAANLWADHLTIEGKYVGITTHQGTLLLSYYPFKNAAEFGVASGNRIEVSLGNNLEVSLVSKAAFLPGAMVGKVYGRYLPKQKSKELNANDITTQNQEEKFIQRFQ
jgi:hypothetical protein